MKPFELGIMVGRFQTFHIGHEYMIEKAVAVCGKVGIFIGSSQESGTAKNPFTYAQREAVLRRAGYLCEECKRYACSEKKSKYIRCPTSE